MLNVQLIYKPPSSWRILFQSGRRPRQSSLMKSFRTLVVPGRRCRRGIIIQVILTPMGVRTNGQSKLIIKGGVTELSLHAPIQSNGSYVNTFIWSIYQTRLPKTLTGQSFGTNDTPRYPIHRPVTVTDPPSLAKFRLMST